MNEPQGIGFIPRKNRKEKVCPWCEDMFSPRSGNHKYCTSRCQDMAKRKRNGKERVIGIGAECASCGELFVKKSAVHRFCSEKCRRAEEEVKQIEKLFGRFDPQI